MTKFLCSPEQFLGSFIYFSQQSYCIKGKKIWNLSNFCCFFRNDSQIENSVVIVDPTFWRNGVCCYDVNISGLKLSSFNESFCYILKLQCPFFSITVLILFKRSILRAWKKLNLFQFFPSLAKLQVFSTISLSSLNRKAALGRNFSYLCLQQSIAIAHDILQAIWIKQVLLQFQELCQYTK